MNKFSGFLMAIYAIIVISAVILDVYLCVDVILSVIDRTKTAFQLTMQIFAILVAVPLSVYVLGLIVLWIIGDRK